MQFHDGPDSEPPGKFLAVNARPGDRRRVVLDVVGEVDASTAPLMQACLRGQLSRPGLRELVLDMRGVDNLGAAGVSVVVEAVRRSRERGVRFRLRSKCRPRVVQALEPTGVIDDLRAVSQAVGAEERDHMRTSTRRRTGIRRAIASVAPDRARSSAVSGRPCADARPGAA